MTTAVTVPFADAFPAEIRKVILPEDQPDFDRQYRAALDVAARTLRLDELEKFLTHWRRIAWSATARGNDSWRALLAEASRRLTGGEPPPGDGVGGTDGRTHPGPTGPVGVPHQDLPRSAGRDRCPA
ncbi:MAG: hypothetical protein JO115_05380 [Pseudonocardiales bacterium]|nr:hypothetical protein [Pseudonocardiales bacterium]